MVSRVCHVTSVHSAFDGRIFYKECCSLAKKYDTYLVAPNVANQTVNNVSIVGVSLPKRRFLRMFRCRAMIPVLMSIDADIYHFHDPELIQIGSKIRRFGKKVVFDSHEDTPLLIKSKTWIPKFLRQFVSILYTNFEARHLSKYDAIVSVTPHIVDRLKQVNPNTYQITNFQIFNEGEDNRHWGRKLCFTGLISPNWNLDKVISVLEPANVVLELAGPGVVDNLATLDGWGNVHYLGVIPHERVRQIIQQCSIGLALESYNNPNAGYKLGSLGVTKLFEYMAAGVPVICTDLVLWKKIVEDAKCGLCVNPYSEEELLKAIKYILDNPQTAKEMGENGLRAVSEQYNWATQEVVLFKMYESLLAR